MRNSLVLFLFFFVINCFGQYNEFKMYKNGLMYSEITMSNLKNISDSLNLKYLQCEIDHTYYSKKQTVGHYVSMDSGDLKSTKADMDNSISLEDFVSKYPQAKVIKDLLIIQFEYTKDDGKTYVDFDEIAIGKRWNHSIENILKKDVLPEYTKKWLYEKNKYSDASLSAFFFPNQFTSKAIPDKYARMIGYSNCMIDTTSSKIVDKAEYGHIDLPEDWQNGSTQEKNNLLNTLRHTQVMGSCSMDDSPRIHAKNIALLSSEVANWNVFLKAHLDIMNDRFERASDGSYAWAGRNTYLKELEELDINTLDLLFGITFRIANSSKHHYFGSPGRIGRAIADSNNRENAEILMASMIEDKTLDVFNRVLIYYTFRSFINFLEDEKIKKFAERRLKESISSFPEYLKSNM